MTQKEHIKLGCCRINRETNASMSLNYFNHIYSMSPNTCLKLQSAISRSFNMHSFYHYANKMDNAIFLLLLNCIISCFHSTTIFRNPIQHIPYPVICKMERDTVFSV